MNKNSIQLTVVGSPDSFDYSKFNDLLAVSSSRGVSLFSSTANGCPLSDVQYEHPSGLTQVKFQKIREGVFSCLNNDNITLFNLNQPTKSLFEVIGNAGKINDHSWSFFNVNMMATCCDAGYMTLWDLKSITAASLQIATGKLCDKVQWCPYDANVVSICCENKYLMLWDIRMLDTIRPKCLNVIEPSYGIVDYTWNLKSASIFIGSFRNSVECWSFDNSGCEMKHSTMCDSLTRHSDLLSLPSGEGVVISNTVQKRLSYVESFNGEKRYSGFEDMFRNNSFESQEHLVGLQWISSDKLFLLTEKSVGHTFTTQSDTPMANFPKMFMLRNSRHMIGSTRDDLEAAQVSPTFNTGVSKKIISRHNSAANAAATAKIAITKDVVGPLSFSSLLENEISSLDSAIRSNLMDGLKIERFDQFGRRVVLDLLIPSVDPFTMRNKVHDGSFSNYYRAEELHQFVKKSSQAVHNHTNRLVSLLISFPSKLVNFWSPTFLVDNKCGIDLGGDNVISKLLSDLSGICKSFLQPSSENHVALSVSPLSLKGIDESNSSDGLLVQLARYFRKSILKQWEKNFGYDRLSVSFGSFRPNSNDNINGSSSKAMLNSVSIGQSFDNIQSTFLSTIDELAHKVPYPVSSGGVFNAKGELVCFGSAILNKVGGETINFPRYPNSPHLNRSYAGYQLAILTRNPVSTNALNSSSIVSYPDGKLKNSDGFEVTVSVDTTTVLNKSMDEDDTEHNDDDADFDYQFSFDKDSRTFPKVQSVNEDVVLKASDPSSSRENSIRDIPRNISVSSYFVADLDFKSDGQPASKSNIDTPVQRFNGEIKVYGSILEPVRRLASQYSLGPLVYSSNAVGVGSNTSNSNKNVLSEFSKRAEACRLNAQVVQTFAPKSRSLFQFWSLLAVALDVYTVVDTGGLIEWNSSVLGCSLLFRLVQYLWKINDLQTFAVAICVAGGSKAVTDLLSVFRKEQFQQSNSVVNFSLVEFTTLAREIDNILISYAEVLRRWGGQSEATAVTKHMTMDYSMLGNIWIESSSTLNVAVHCNSCDKIIDKKLSGKAHSSERLASYCQDCQDWAQYCAICQTCTRGYFAVCSMCGHGGHTAHMRLWFETCGECATGCGCRCSFVLDAKEPLDDTEGEDSENDEEDIYYRGDVIDVYGGTKSHLEKSTSGYDTYDFNRPLYMDLGESNYSYNYNNFYETMKDFPSSIIEEGSGSEDEDD